MKVILEGGEEIELGTVETAPTIGIIDYSRRVTDEFGVTTVVKRGFARRMSVRLALASDDVDDVQRRLADLRATPAQWIADDSLAWLSFEGFYKDFELDLAVPPLSFCTLTVEGLAESEPGIDDSGDPAPVGSPSTLHLVNPFDVTDAELAASTVAEADQPEWAAGTTYASGALVMKAATHRIYESAAGGNLGNDPASGSGHWIDTGPTNRWAMFDQALGTVTTAASAIAVTLNVTAVDAVALLDVVAVSVRVQAPGYDQTRSAADGSLKFLDLPATTGQITVTIAGSGTVSVGTLLLGRLVQLGITEAAPTAGIIDYSRKDTDEFGEVTIVQRAWAKRMSARALIRTDAIDDVANRIAAVRARPCLWIGDETLDSLTVYGFFKDFSIEVGANVSTLSLSIEGLSQAAPKGVLAPNWTDIIDNDPVNHPKPADGADVTGENTSADTVNVGGRPSLTVIESLDFNTVSILSEALRQDNLLLIFDARTLVAGQPVGTVFLAFKEEQEGVNSASAASFALMGAKNGAGTAWNMNLSTVMVSPTQSMAQKFEEIGVATAGVTASVQSLQEIVFGPDGTRASAIFKTNVNGNVAGLVLSSTEETSEIGFVASSVKFYSTTGVLLAAMEEDSGQVFIPNLKVDTFQVGSITTTAIGINQVCEGPEWNDNFSGARGDTLGAVSTGVWSAFGNVGNKCIMTFASLPAGAMVKVLMQFNAQRDGDDNDRVNFRLKRVGPDGTTYHPTNFLTGMANYPSNLTYLWRDSISITGAYTYHVEYMRVTDDGLYYACHAIADAGKR